MKIILLIIASILSTQPGTDPKVARKWATELVHQAQKYHFDPLAAAALIRHESHWRASVSNGKYVGFGQIDASLACGGSAACIATLQDGVVNIRIMSQSIAKWRRLCQQKVRHSGTREWLWGYGGYVNPAKDWCGWRYAGKKWQRLPDPRGVEEVLAIHKELQQQHGKDRIGIRTQHHPQPRHASRSRHRKGAKRR